MTSSAGIQKNYENLGSPDATPPTLHSAPEY